MAAAALVAIAVIASAAVVSMSWLKSAQPASVPAAAVNTVAKTPPVVAEPVDPVPTLSELLAPPAAEGGFPSMEELVRRSMPAVVKVETPQGTGSGFFVSNDTLITNFHVVGREQAVNVRLTNGIKRLARVIKTYDASTSRS